MSDFSQRLQASTLAEIDRVLTIYPQKRSAALPVLHALQEDQGYISNEAIEWAAVKLGLQPINLYELVTFYPHFRRQPIGQYHIRLCRTLSCALCGGYKMADILEEEFGCKMGETSEDRRVTLEFVECLAACGTAPVCLIGDDLYERLDEPKLRSLCRQIKAGTLEPRRRYCSEPRDQTISL